MKVSIIGASGYAGEELIRLLHGHPHAEIVHLTSERHTGEKISKLYPHLTHIYDNILDSMEDVRRIAEDSDVLFIALPHGHAMKLVKAIAGLPVHIIDLGADYRFADTSVYESSMRFPVFPAQGVHRRRARISRSSMTVLRRMAQSVIDTPRKSSKRSLNRQVSRLRLTLRRTLPRLHAVSLPRAMHALRTA